MLYSQKIIDGRPYARRTQLKSKKIIPSTVYDKIKRQDHCKAGAQEEVEGRMSWNVL